MFVKVFLVVVLVGPFQNALSDHLHPREYTSIQPNFEHSLYTKPFKDGKLEDLKVRVINGRGRPVLIKEDGDIWQYFEVVRRVENDDDEFIVRSRDGIKWDRIKDAVFTLLIDDATLYPPVETVVIIKSEEVSIGQPRFEFSLYTAELLDGFLESLKVRVIDGRGMPVLIKGDEDIGRYFEVIREVETGADVFIVRSKDGMKWDKIEDAVFLLLIDDATLYPPVETVVIIKSEEVSIGQPHFEFSLYTAEFVDGFLESLKVRVIDERGMSVLIKEDEDIRRYFEVIRDVETGDDVFIVKSKYDMKWEQMKDAVFTLLIDDETLDFPVETVVIIKSNLRQADFERPFYVGKFIDGMLDELFIRVINDFGIVPQIKEEEIRKYFEVIATTTTGDYVVRSKESIRWTADEDAMFTLKIDDSSLYSPAETAVIVKKEKQVPKRPPLFEKSIYITEFVDGTLYDLRIKVIDGIGVGPTIAENEINHYFEVIVDSKFPEAVYIVRTRAGMKWTSSQDAIFTLRIDDSALLSPVETVVIVKMNFRHADFEQPFYVSEFIHGILNPLFIRVINDFEVYPQIKEEEMAMHFEVIATTTAGDYVVRSKESIRWTEDEDAMFTLKIDDSSLYSPVETAVIVKQVPRRPPVFEKSIYTAEFVDGILDDLKVKVIDGFEVVPIIAETEINDYFEVIVDLTFPEEVYIVRTKAGTKWTFDVDAIFTLRIDDSSLISSVETVVIVKKEVFQINLPHFEKSAYISEFKDGVLEEIKVKVLDSFRIVPNIVEKDLWNYFEVTYEYPYADDEFIIRSINGIKWDKNQDAIFTLQIADSSLNFPIETVVIVKWKEVACEQGNLLEVHRPRVFDVNTYVLNATGMSDYGVPVIVAMSENADKYTGILNQGTSLQVILKDIQKFEETTASNKNAPSLRIELVNFAQTCPIQIVDFQITILDTNNNDPVFTDKNGVSKDTFEVNVPMYFPKKVESFEAIIYAKDVDLTNTKVTFSIEPEDGGTKDLDIEYGEVVDDLNKVHCAIIRSTAALNYQNRRYMVTVEDEGTKDEGKRTATGTITVKRNQEERVITLKFEKSSYTARVEDHRREDLNL